MRDYFEATKSKNNNNNNKVAEEEEKKNDIGLKTVRHKNVAFELGASFVSAWT